MRSEKDELLESYDDYRQAASRIGYKELVIAFLLLVIALLVFMPKIYLTNEIYFTSRKINKLLDEYEILKEENRILKQRLEQERFKAEVLDTIF